MEWLLDYKQSGIYVLIALIIMFIGVILTFIIDVKYQRWKLDYYRDKDLLMRKEKLLYRIFREFNART